MKRIALSILLLSPLVPGSGCFDPPHIAVLGEACRESDECGSGFCYQNICLDPGADDDGDGLSNEFEARIGSDVLLSDTDGDGVLDRDELGPNLARPRDSDGDGTPDFAESRVGDLDGDCLPDDLDPQDRIATGSLSEIKAIHCPVLGICADHAEAVVASCENGSASCNYDGVPGFDGPEETKCDGVDGDCDGEVDDPFTVGVNPMGAPCPALGSCGPGEVECAPDGLAAVCSSQPGGTGDQSSVETCDGKDNDCDGETDEDFGLGSLQVGDACMATGVCGAGPGTLVCHPLLGELQCVGPPGSLTATPGPEICDSLDNDCDGSTDEGVTFTDPGGEPAAKGAPCGVGQCALGIVVCDEDGQATCSTLLLATEEVCDGLDNNCDGKTDDGIAYLGQPVGAPCEGLGVCGTGTVECAEGGGLATCSTHMDGSESEASPEQCDRLDNNCNGLVDDGLAFQGVPLGGACDGTGACGEGQVECSPDGETACSSNPDGSLSEAVVESCDGEDNDCDGVVDEALVGSGEDCGALGVCAEEGTSSCEAGIWVCLAPEEGAGFEPESETSCDTLDNDCDGDTDEGVAMIFGPAWENAEVSGQAPTPRVESGAALDPSTGSIYVHGGRPSPGSDPILDTWRLASGAWEPLASSSGEGVWPPEGSVAWDAVGEQLLLVPDGPLGGAKVWTLDADTGSWTTPGDLPGDSPPAANGICVTTDHEGERVIRAGGVTPSDQEGGVWALNLSVSAWEELPGSGHPAAGLAPAGCAWDAVAQRLLVAGTTASGSAIEVWSMAPISGSWMLVHVITPPTGDTTRPVLAVDAVSRIGTAAIYGELFELNLDGGDGAPAPWLDAQDDHAFGATIIYETALRNAYLLGGINTGGTATSAVRALASECP